MIQKMPPLLLLVLTLVPLSHGENPAIQVVLNDKGLNYGTHVAAGWIQDRLGQFTFPDISGEISISVFGSIYYTASDLTITKCDFPEPSVQFYQDASGLKASVSGLSVALSGSWSSHYGIIHSSGTMDVALINVDVTSVLQLSRDAAGHLQLSSVNCGAQVQRLDVRLHGGESWAVRPIVDHYNDKIRSEIQNGICPHVDAFVGDLEYLLQSMNVSFDVYEDITLQLPLTSNPEVNISSLNLGLKGEFICNKPHVEPPFKSQPFSVPQQPNFMLSLGLSEYTLNSGSFSLFSAGRMQILITDSMIPPGTPLHLNTSFMGPYAPQLPQKFPDLLMDLKVKATEAPAFTLQPGVVALKVRAEVGAEALLKNGTHSPLFTIRADLAFKGKVWISEGKLRGSTGLSNLTLTLVSSAVGPVKIDAIQKLVKMGSAVALMNLNKILGQGVDLPRMRCAELVDTQLTMQEGFISVGSNAKVLLPDRK